VRDTMLRTIMSSCRPSKVTWVDVGEWQGT
jgi:hypothetical protein